MVSSDEFGDDHEEQQQPEATPRVQNPRSRNSWLVDKMTVTEIDEGGMPTDIKQKLRL